MTKETVLSYSQENHYREIIMDIDRKESYLISTAEGRINLPEDQTSVPYSKYWGRDDITEAVLSVNEIGTMAFSHCGHLKTVIPAEGLERIGREAFSFCREMTEIVIPESTKIIESYAFLTCRNLRRAVILSPDVQIGYEAFLNCPKDMAVIVPKDSHAEGYAAENGRNYTYTDGSLARDHFEISRSADGTQLKNCYVRKVYSFDCSAVSEGGIEEHSTEVTYYPIRTEQVTEVKGVLTEVRIKDHICRMDDPSTFAWEEILKDGYVGGWGDVTEKNEYRLFVGIPPVEPVKEKPD